MAKKALEDVKFEVIKAHCFNPANSPLSEADQELLNRIMSIARELDRYPIQKKAVELHMLKYPEISRSQAYEDCKFAMRLFNTQYSFEYDRWHSWLLQDICDLIEECKNQKDDPKALRAWALAHSNLIKAIGEKPTDKIDPKLVESNTFIIPIQINQVSHNFDLMKFLKLPDDIRKKVADALISEIDEIKAGEIMDT